jgi:rfaE bifunctional protein kinase chain/domain
MTTFDLQPGEAEWHARLLGLIDTFSSRRVLVIGDVIADEFIYGEVARVSREAPVLILKYDATQMVAGGAGNAANNVAALGGLCRLVGVVGQDAEGARLRGSFARGVDRKHLVRVRGYRTPVKTRILAGGVHSAKQQIVRIDREPGWPLSDEVSRVFASKIGPLVEACDAVVLSDYGSGLVTPALAAEVKRAVRRYSKQHVPILVDSRYRLMDYRGFTACTPNESEVEQALGVRINESIPTLNRVGRRLLTRARMAAALVTRGSRGMSLFEQDQPPVHIPIFGSDEVADVTGAGDTVIAAFSLALAAGATFYEAARLANYAGGLVVMKRGTATVSAAELADAVTSDHGTPLEPWLDQPRRGGTGGKSGTGGKGRTGRTNGTGRTGGTRGART